jgi:hypothetical protein
MYTNVQSVMRRRARVQGSRDSDPAKVEFIGPHVFLWEELDQGSLRNHFGDVMDQKFEEKQAILRIYGF